MKTPGSWVWVVGALALAMAVPASAAEYVVVTSETLAPAFERLVEWRQTLGVAAELQTIEMIQERYPGVDAAQRLRRFLQDAHATGQLEAVLLAGDVDHVPSRTLASSYFVTARGEHWDIPADIYFAALDGDFNADGDALFGEVGDQVDLAPELSVGRAPVGSAAEAARFVARQIEYERGRGVGAGFPQTAVVFAEVLFRDDAGDPIPGQDGARYAEDVVGALPSAFQTERYYEADSAYEGDRLLTVANALEALTAGPGLVVHIGHGFRNTLSLGDGAIANAQVSVLTNGRARPIVLALNCTSAAFDFDSIGEEFVKSQAGGAIAYVGMSRFAFPSTAAIYQRVLVGEAFAGGAATLGEALRTTREVLAPLDRGDQNANRYTQYALTLLGDPLTPLWRATPAQLVLDAPHDWLPGEGLEVRVEAGDQPVAGATVVLRQAGAWHRRVTDATGGAVFPAAVVAPAPAELSAWAPGTLPAVGLVCGPPGATAAPQVRGLRLLEPLRAGYASGLLLRLSHTGVDPTSAGVASLRVLEGPVQVTHDVVPVASLAGGAALDVSGLALEVEASAHSGAQVVLELTVELPDPQSSQHVFWVEAPRVRRLGHAWVDADGDSVPEAGEAIDWTFRFANAGSQASSPILARLRLLHRAGGHTLPGAFQPDSLWLPRLAPARAGTTAPVRLELPAASDPAAWDVELRYATPLAPAVHGGPPVVVERIDWQAPPPPATALATASDHAVRLEWPASAATDRLGYEVERAASPAGPFLALHEVPLQAATFSDIGVGPRHGVFYRVRAVDTSLNRSPWSAPVAATTNPPLAAGFPIDLGQQTASSPTLADLDGDGAQEIVVGAEVVYVVTGNGSDWLDGDGNASTAGPFTRDGFVAGKRGVHAAPAVADLNGDGTLEIVAATWEDTHVHVWESGGTPLAGWPRPLAGPPNWATPVVADLDGDGTPEVASVSGAGGVLSVWHQDGTELRDGDGDPSTDGVFFASGASFSFGSAAAAPLDDTPGAELIVGFDEPLGTLHAFRSDGTEAPGWPRALGGRLSASPAVVDLDGDGTLEVLVAVEDDSVHVLEAGGAPRPGWPQAAQVDGQSTRSASVVAADWLGDATLEVVFAANDGRLHVWSAAGELLDVRHFASDPESQAAGATQATPILGDVDGDGRPEVILGAEDGRLYAWRADGGAAPGFPIQLSSEVRGAAALGDVDGDGDQELVAAHWGKELLAWKVGGRSSLAAWPSFRFDPANTGYKPGPRPRRPALPKAGGLWVSPSPWQHGALAVAFRLPAAGRGRLRVFDVAGRRVRTLMDGPCPAGQQTVGWDGLDGRGRPAPAGVYWLALEAQGERQVRRVVRLR